MFRLLKQLVSRVATRKQKRSRINSFDFKTLEARKVLTTIAFDSGTGQLTLTGDASADIVSIEYNAGQLVVTAQGSPTQTFTASEVNNIYFTGEGGNDQLFNNSAVPLQAYGGEGNDIITGGTADDTIHGGAGNDVLAGADGADLINGSDDADYITGGDGHDNLRGGDGEDEIYGNDGNDKIFGERDNDELYGGLGADSIQGFTGDDRIEGGEGTDYLYGQIGNDYILGQDDNDNIRGGHGDDEIHGGEGDDNIGGDLDNDTLYGDAGDDLINGYAGNDTIRGGDDVDRIYGKEGEDVIDGDAGDDLIRGGDDNDYLEGSEGEDRIYGDAGNDRLYGHEGVDFLVGGEGNDGLFGGESSTADSLFGQGGGDRFLFQENDTVRDRDSEDAVLNFVDETDNWLDVEIQIVDDAFNDLHERTNNTVLLQDSVDSGDLTYYKYASLGGSAGINYLSYSYTGSYFFNFRREIHIADWDETSQFYNDQFTDVVLHETAHNWDSELELTQYDASLTGLFEDFSDISGWTQDDKSGDSNYRLSRDGQWYYLNSATFAENYGRTNPYEDSATMWEYYFNNQDLSSHGDLQGKVDWLDSLLDTLSS